MAGYLATNAQPRGYALGIKDESRGNSAPERITTPQFYPLLYILAQRTYDDAIIISGNGADTLGQETINRDSAYYTHQNAFLKNLMKKGNQCVVQTIKLPGSSKAFLRISVEVITTDIPVYERITDENLGQVGDFVTDEFGAYNQTGTIIGSKLVHHVGVDAYTGTEKLFGGAIIKPFRAGSTVVGGAPLSSITVGGSTEAAQTTLYPIADIELTAYGAHGNLTGLSILSPTTRDENGPFVRDLKENRSVSYRLVTVKKSDINSSPVPKFLLTGDQALDATLKLETVSSISGNPISLSKTLVPAYSRKASSNTAAIYGDWGRVKIYDQSLETLLGILANGYTVSTGSSMVDVDGEGSFDADPVIGQTREDWAMLSDPINTHLINIFSGEDHNGVPYGSFTTMDSVALGGSSFSSATPQFASGGADGIYYYSDGRPAKEVNAKLFDDAVANELKTFGEGHNKYKDVLKYPISTIIDSGFSLDTKLEMPNILIKRPDMYVLASTHAVYDIGQTSDPNTRSIYRDGNVTDVDNVQNLVSNWGVCPQQSIVQEDSYGAVLKAAFNTTMESDYWSTPVTRAIIRGGSGTVISEDIWTGFLPVTYHLVDSISDFAGDSSGVWRNNFDFTIEPNNIVDTMENLNNTYRENTSYSKLWDIGVNWSASYDQFRYYTPALQTVYPYDDSVLNSAKMMMACCRLEYLNLIVHSRLTGRDDLTDDEFIQQTKKIAEEEADGIFAGKYIVESEPKILDGDREKGYVWRNFYHIYGNVMKTAMIYGVIAKRMSDYTGT